MKYWLKRNNGLNFIGKWAYLGLFLLVPVFYFFVLSYYTPRSFHLRAELSCEEQQCKFKTDDSEMQKINTDLQDQIEDASRLDEFAKPFGGFIRVRPRVTNNSTFTINISNPAQEIPQKALYDCELLPSKVEIFSYGAGIFFDNKSSLAGVPDLLKSVSNTLLGCFRAFETRPSGKGIIVAPNATVSFKDPRIDFLVEFLPDGLSKLLVALEVIAVFLGLLPLVGQGVKFTKKGWQYFTE